MKKTVRRTNEENSTQAANCLAILAIVTEMARRLNENISKVRLESLDNALVVAASRDAIENSKA